MRPEDLLTPTPAGLGRPSGSFHIDPLRAVDRALITHAHSDHARAGHRHALATQETLDLMRLRHGDDFAGSTQAVGYGEIMRLGDVAVSFHPAGHVLGSAQILVEGKGMRIIASGDYKDQPDPTRAPFVPVACDVFISEATFGLPVFSHGDPAGEIGKLLRSRALFPERTHLVGAYALGKAQRLIALLRCAGYDEPIYLHGALETITRYYAERFDLGELRFGVEEQACRGDRALSAFGAERPVDARLSRSHRMFRLGLDAGAGACAPARRRAAAGHLRSLRLGRAHPHNSGDGRFRSVGHAR